MSGRQSLTLERDVQRALRQIYEAIGGFVYSTSTYQTRRTLVTPGTPDLIVLHPKFGVLFHEVKGPMGRLSEAQELFAARCKRTKAKYVCGGVQEAYRFLWVEGVLAGGQTLADMALRGVDNGGKLPLSTPHSEV